MLKYMCLPYIMNQNGVQTIPQGAREGSEPLLVLTLENVGPLSEARIELVRGLTVLYGLHSTGKTTVAKALRLLALMNAGVATVGDVVTLVRRHLRYVDRPQIEEEIGRIVYNTNDVGLEVRCAPDVRGAWLKIGRWGWERYVDMNERLPAVSKPRIALLWVAHDSIKLYGAGAPERRLALEDLLAPSVFRNVVAGIYDDAMDLYEEVLDKVNKMLETVDYKVEYRDGVYFKKSIHVYTLDETSSGIRRFTIIYLAAVLAKTFAKYAKVEPVLFVENVEDSLDVTLMSAVIDVLRTKGVISVAETHSGFPLKAAVARRNMNYYVFTDGRVTRDLKVELFKKEIAEWADLNAL
jgi:hypothetical protein